MANCRHCDQEFTPRYKAQIYCSRACYHSASSKIKGDTLCKQCGKRLEGHQRYQRRNYCSLECYNAHRAADLIVKICPVCSKVFEVPAAVAERYTVCSRACRIAETKYVTCERCGKRFRAEKNLDRHYCSEECRRPPEYAICATCGQPFRKEPKANRRFCCFACYRRFNGESGIEKAVRLALDEIGIPYLQEFSVGRYSIDFLIPNAQLAIEVDGDYWHQDKARDDRKSQYLQRRGIQVVRISESEIEASHHLPSLIWEILHQYLGESSNGKTDARAGSQFLVQSRLLMEL